METNQNQPNIPRPTLVQEGDLAILRQGPGHTTREQTSPPPSIHNRPVTSWPIESVFAIEPGTTEAKSLSISEIAADKIDGFQILRHLRLTNNQFLVADNHQIMVITLKQNKQTSIAFEKTELIVPKSAAAPDDQYNTHDEIEITNLTEELHPVPEESTPKKKYGKIGAVEQIDQHRILIVREYSLSILNFQDFQKTKKATLDSFYSNMKDRLFYAAKNFIIRMETIRKDPIATVASNFIFINHPRLSTIFEITRDKKNIRYLTRYHFNDLHPLIASMSEACFAIGRKDNPIVIIKFDDLRKQPHSDHHDEEAKELSDIFHTTIGTGPKDSLLTFNAIPNKNWLIGTTKKEIYIWNYDDKENKKSQCIYNEVFSTEGDRDHFLQLHPDERIILASKSNIFIFDYHDKLHDNKKQPMIDMTDLSPTIPDNSDVLTLPSPTPSSSPLHDNLKIQYTKDQAFSNGNTISSLNILHSNRFNVIDQDGNLVIYGFTQDRRCQRLAEHNFPFLTSTCKRRFYQIYIMKNDESAVFSVHTSGGRRIWTEIKVWKSGKKLANSHS